MKVQVDLKIRYQFDADDDVAAVALFNQQRNSMCRALHKSSDVSGATFKYTLGGVGAEKCAGIGTEVYDE